MAKRKTRDGEAARDGTTKLAALLMLRAFLNPNIFSGFRLNI